MNDLDSMVTKLRASLPKITEAFVQKAMDGDVNSVRLVVQLLQPKHVIPGLKSGSISERADALMEAYSNGDISSAECRDGLDVLQDFAKIAVNIDIAEQVQSLVEGKTAKPRDGVVKMIPKGKK